MSNDRVEQLLAEARLAREEALEEATARIIDRFGTERHKRYTADPNGPRVDPVELIDQVLSTAYDARRTDQPTPATEDFIDTLRLIAPAREELDALELGVITRARRSGATWKQIAAALGLDSPQAAQQRTQRLARRVNPGAKYPTRVGP